PRSPNASQPTFYPRADLSRMRRRRRGFAARLAGGKAGGPMRIVEGRVRVAASDVANFLACQELTQLDLRAARRTLRPPHPRDLGFEDLVRRGEEHELGVLEGVRAAGCEVADLSGAGDPAGATAAAIRGGAGVIYQGTLAGAGLFGRPDFLVRADLLPAPDGEPRPGGRHYEVVDAKLARTAKARAVLQTEVYPEPVEHCAICRWRDMCRDRRRTDDDLSLVAGITTGQRRALKGAGIP